MVMAVLDMRDSGRTSRLAVPLAFAAIYLFWSSTFLGIKFALADIPPVVMVGVRSIAAGLIFIALGVAFGNKLPGWRAWATGAVSGCLLVIGSHVMVAIGEQHVSSGITALAVAGLPLWLPLLGWMTGMMARPDARSLVSIVIGFLGVMLLLTPAKEARMEAAPWSVLIVFLSSVGWALGTLVSRRYHPSPSAVMTAGIQLTVGGIVCLPIALALGEFSGFSPAAVGLPAWLGLGYLIVFGSLLGFGAFSWLTQVCEPQLVATYAYINPVLALFIGWMVAGEHLTPTALAAAALIIGAVITMMWPKHVV